MRRPHWVNESSRDGIICFWTVLAWRPQAAAKYKWASALVLQLSSFPQHGVFESTGLSPFVLAPKGCLGVGLYASL